MEEKKYELIKFKDGDFSLDVKVAPNEDTVWLTANQIALLFDRDEKTIRKHINNVFNEHEVDYNNTQNLRVVGVKQKVSFYSLDVIISVGYRVKSQRGVVFRRWATRVLKEFLLKGYLFNQERCLSCTTNILELQKDYKKIMGEINNLKDTIYSNNSKIIYEGEILEPYTFLRKLFFLARKEIIIIDRYADKFLLSMLKDIKVNIYIIASSNSYLNKEVLPDNITIINNDIIHDRFIIIDDIVYLLGTSINDIGKKRFVIVRLENIKKEMIIKNNTNIF